MTRAAAGPLAAALLLLTPAAGADESSAARRAAAAHERGRPYTMFELGGGFLTLPAADVCPSPDQCEQGETSIAVGLHNLYRYRDIAIGAGIQWATTLGAETAAGAPELERDHSRRYFLVEAQFRYYGIRASAWELWGGATLGGVVVNDSWSVKADREPYADTAFVGPRAATIGTEGLAAGVAIGAEWTFASNWSFGSQIRYSSWFLPSEPERLPTGDRASLQGRVDMIDFVLALAYRIAL